MTIPDDVEYRLDADHIRSVCRAAVPDSTVNVTHHAYPSTVFVDVYDKHRAARALRQVGYEADLPGGELQVRGWSEDGLHSRITSLIGTLERLHQNVPDAAARAVDAFATRFPHDYQPGSVEAARADTLAAMRDVLHREVDIVTGPRALHDPHIRPDDDHTAELFDQTRSLEHALGRGLDLAETVAAYAIDVYAQLRIEARASPSAARRTAITRAMAKIPGDTRRSSSPSGNEAARLAATDFPRPDAEPTADTPPAPRAPADRTPHRRTT